MKTSSRFSLAGIALIASVVLASGLTAKATDTMLPHMVRKDGRRA